ncbi:MAG: hypothetical protein A2912_04205 [Candidatus Buchananbacteria bacterium RIFCSPLOWO2_01_FULL_40_23b]|uniref:Uncharacterized protein n=1 Tax=Candidatus Buchananbacteria bacterium RIFCSPLOWO2_01_FULL_40_23b TaxID=1797544 RepID=A0A1G1YLG0_9BACT|nr:MAG: hypothetical protein A2912_04205 [Candidatus Buchananbacteria bacterium RIFCSPLOWO2_01_FULL_40_23b]
MEEVIVAVVVQVVVVQAAAAVAVAEVVIKWELNSWRRTSIVFYPLDFLILDKKNNNTLQICNTTKPLGSMKNYSKKTKSQAQTTTIIASLNSKNTSPSSSSLKSL